MLEIVLKALNYLLNMGGETDIELFDEDHELVGKELRFMLEDREFAEVYDKEDQGVLFIKITDKGKEAFNQNKSRLKALPVSRDD